MPQIGEFDPHLRAIVRLTLRGREGREQTIEARLDTGFDLPLAVPEGVLRGLDLPYVRSREMLLANGEAIFLSEHSARILWQGLERPIRVISKPGIPLVGIALFSGYRLTLSVVDGGAIFCDELE